MAVTVSGLYVYPIKSCAGIALDRAQISAAGVQWDRQFILVDAAGAMMTQRTVPRMVLIQPALDLELNQLRLQAPGASTLTVSLDAPQADDKAIVVRVWSGQPQGMPVSDQADQWFSQVLGQPCRLLRLHPESQRRVMPEFPESWQQRHRDWMPLNAQDQTFGFADGFPFLFASTASLDALNATLAGKQQAPVHMIRFRPNIVLDGLPEYEEDYVFGLTAGKLNFAFVKPCTRCTIPNVDPASATFADEPGITLMQTRSADLGVLFGVNAVLTDNISDVLHIGQQVQPEYDF
jgi:uncharacterized protein YcbX